MAAAGDPSGHDRRMVTLLTVLVALVGVLVAGLAVGAAFAARTYARVDAALERTSGQRAGDLGEVARQVREALTELTARQERAAGHLGRVAETTESRIEALENQARHLRNIESGPMDKMAQMIELQQLMVEEMLTMLRHFAGAHGTMAEALRPLPTQREAAPPGGPEQTGVGGSEAGTPPGR